MSAVVNQGTVLPHPEECCARGLDHRVEDRTYVRHETEDGRAWGHTVLADGVGTIVERWGPAP